MRYDVSVGRLHVGSGTMALTVGDSLRGHATLHAVFQLRAGFFLLRVDDLMESWFDSSTLTTVRFVQRLREGRYRADRVFELYPERSTYVQAGEPEQASVADPLDDLSFLYFLRTIPLEVGRRYEFHRYFQPAGNPVVISVLRREQISVPAGTFDAIVVRPEIATDGLFSQNGQAEVWLQADAPHAVLKVHARLSVTSITLALASRDSASAARPRMPVMVGSRTRSSRSGAVQLSTTH